MSNVPPPPPAGVPPDPFANQSPPPGAVEPPPETRPGWSSGVPGGIPIAPPMSGGPPAYPAPDAAGAPAGYQPYAVEAMQHHVASKSGMLLAGGILSVMLAVFVGFVGLAIALLGSVVGGIGGVGASIALFGLAIAAFAAFGFVGGIGAIMRRQWGRICTIVFGGIHALFALATIVAERDGGGLIYLAFSATTVGLCVAGPASPA